MPAWGVAVVPAMEQGTSTSSAQGESLVRLSDRGAHRDVGLAWSERRSCLPRACCSAITSSEH